MLNDSQYNGKPNHIVKSYHEDLENKTPENL